MKKVLVSRQMLPLSMMKAHTTGFPQQAAPCAPSMQPFYHAEPIPKVMLDVIFESDKDLNLHHWDTLNRLFEIGVISETQPGGTE